MPKFNKTSKEYVIFNIREILDTTKSPKEIGILAILECLSVDGAVNKSDYQSHFDFDLIEEVEQIATDNGYILISSESDSSPKKKQREVKRFSPPTVDEVKDYMQSIGMLEPERTAERFIAYYTSNGWMVGKLKMKDWKSACVTWKTRQLERSNQPPPGMVRVFPRGSQKTIIISKEDYERSVKSGTNYYKLAQ